MNMREQEGTGGRMTQEVSSLPHQRNEVLEGRTQGTGSDLGMYSSKAFATAIRYANMKGEPLGDVVKCSDVM